MRFGGPTPSASTTTDGGNRKWAVTEEDERKRDREQDTANSYPFASDSPGFQCTFAIATLILTSTAEGGDRGEQHHNQQDAA